MKYSYSSVVFKILSVNIVKAAKDLVCCLNDFDILILKSRAGWYLGILVILRYGNVTKPVSSTIISMPRFLLYLGTLLRSRKYY